MTRALPSTSSAWCSRLPFRPQVLLELADAHETCVNVDCHELAHFNAACGRLYEQLVRYPQEVRPRQPGPSHAGPAARWSTAGTAGRPPLTGRCQHLTAVALVARPATRPSCPAAPPPARRSSP